jgi:hypothetical protein
LEDDVTNAPQQPRFLLCLATIMCTLDRDWVDQDAPIPLDDGIGRVKISIQPSPSAGSENYLEWEMRVIHIFEAHHYTEDN